MTAIAGLVANQCIVLASDSQNTNGMHKRMDVRKIHRIPILGGPAMIAECGASDLSGRAIEMIVARSSTMKLDSQYRLRTLTEEVVRTVNRLVTGEFPPGASPESLHSFVSTHKEFSLTGAHYWKGKPVVFTISNTATVAERVNEHCFSNGCGGDIVRLLLEESSEPNMAMDEALALALYTIEKAKQYNPFCGGETHACALMLVDETIGEAIAREQGRDVPDSAGFCTFNQQIIQQIADGFPEFEKAKRKEIRTAMGKLFKRIFDVDPTANKTLGQVQYSGSTPEAGGGMVPPDLRA